MRCLVQRVGPARVEVEGRVVGAIHGGLLALVGFGPQDGPDLPASPVWGKMSDKLLGLRVFPDAAGKLNLSVEETGGGLLLVSQFTLYADCRKGRRPSFHLAAPPEVATALFQRLVDDLSQRLPGRVASGVFGAAMDVHLVNQGPVTILLDSAEL